MIFLDVLGGFGEGAKIATEHDGIGGVIRQAIRPILYNINELIYGMMMNLYQLFEYLCNARLLDSDVLSGIASRAGVTLGIVMLFRVMFNFIQLVLDPDKSNDKEVGSTAIIKKCLLVIIMLGVSSYFFDALLYVQRFVINEKIIYKLVLPEKQTIETANFGGVLAARTFGAFYTTNESFLATNNSEDYENALQCVDLRNLLLQEISQLGDFSAGNECLLAYGDAQKKVNPDDENSATVKYEGFIMDYNWVLQTIVGVMLVYILVNYAIKVGVRVIQLTVLQIISPMAIVSYLSPKKDNMFSKWWKIYFATYIDAFIRMAIIYFIIYICSLILDSWESGFNTFFESVGSPTDYYTRGVFAVTMILALLTFAKKAPDLIKELMPASASKLGFGASMKDIVGLQKGIGMVAGATTASAVGLIGGIAGGKGFSKFTGAVGGLLGGAVRGAHSGFGAKGIGSAITSARSTQAKASLARAQRITSGTTLGEAASDSVRGFFGIEGMNARLSSELSMSSEIKATLEKEDIIKHIDEVRQSYIQAKAQRGEVADASVLADYDKQRKAALQQMYEAAYRTDSSKAATINVDLLGADGITRTRLSEEYDSNRGIHNQIRTNERRSGKNLSTWTAYKDDNNELKTRIAETHKRGK